VSLAPIIRKATIPARLDIEIVRMVTSSKAFLAFLTSYAAAIKK
jgi:hypothetical protein